MIQLPPSFDLASLISDYAALGSIMVTIAGIITTLYIIKKTASKI